MNGGFLILLLVGCVALIGWVVIESDKEMGRKEVAFMTACAADGRKPYDCNLQWETYEAAHAAQQQAALASGMAAGAMGASAGR